MSEPETTPKAASEPLTQREVIDLLFRNPAVRAYESAALASLAMIFVIMFMNGSDIGAVLVVLLGCAGLVLRWVAAPVFLLLVLCYFQLFPFGFPEAGYASVFLVRDTHFQVIDAILAMSVLVYLRSQYRIFGLVHQAVPFENVIRRKGEGPTRRPADHIAPGELGWMLGIAGAIVILGQLAWWLVNALEFTPTEAFPIHWIQEETNRTPTRRESKPPGEFNAGANRFFILIGGLFFGTLVARLVFGYWRLRMMNPTEGAMVLVDTSWAESHRERVRVEKWRIWGRQRAAKQAKEAERAEREREREQEKQRQRRAKAAGRSKR
ncbi:MAG: hypothetical protein L0241_25040 [Planctomycetia bacterium]|nr:hypothetical protein [Planctomycetia bacterium]